MLLDEKFEVYKTFKNNPGNLLNDNCHTSQITIIMRPLRNLQIEIRQELQC